jgi:hypothetical protein
MVTNPVRYWFKLCQAIRDVQVHLVVVLVAEEKMEYLLSYSGPAPALIVIRPYHHYHHYD